MSYRLIRVLICDCEGCEADSPYSLQGEDDQAIVDGWTEHESAHGGPKLHACKACTDAGKVPIVEKPLTVMA